MFHLLAQQGTSITGTVFDNLGEPLPGVNVVVKGTTTGVVTGTNGSYSITVPDNAVLMFSFMGYATQEFVVGDQRTIDVILSEDTQQIEEVVVVGYGTQKAGNLTASISVIKAQEIQITSTSDVTLKLQGKVAGFNIRQNTGQPGSYDNAINVRGFGTPLFVIDGIQRPASVFMKLNGAAIESISILKDASAAIYGMNAANGVAMVTTKQGKSTGKTDFQFSTNIGFSTPTEMPRMCNAYEYWTLRNEAELNIGLGSLISKEELEKWKEGGPGYESTDWYGNTFRKYQNRQEYNLSAEGGTNKVTYFLNLNGAFDNGLLKTNDLYYRRLSFLSNITAQLTDRIRARVNVSVMNDQDNSNYVGIAQLLRGVTTALPTEPVYANGNPMYLNNIFGVDILNPVALSSSDLTGFVKANSNVYNTLLELSYNVPYIDGLTLKATGAYDKIYTMNKTVRKDFDLYNYNVASDTYVPSKQYDPSMINNGYNNEWYLTLLGQVDYRKSIKNAHNIGVTFVYEARSAAARYAGINKYFDFFTNDQIDYATETDATSTGNEWQTRNMSYVGKINYDYKGRYLIEFAGRYDGSYRYHPDKRWTFFPIVSGGWRISDESFMSWSSNVLSNMKIRASYGKSGEDVGNPFQYVPGFTTGGGWWEFADGKTTLGLNTPAIVNEQLSWITSETTDIGVDFSFFNNRLSFTFDWYQKDKSGLLAYRNVSLPNTYGGTFPQENLNSLRLRGYDFVIEHNNTIGEVNYRISGNFCYSRWKWDYVEQGTYTNSYSEYRSNPVDRWQGTVWNYRVIGRYQTEEEVANGSLFNSTKFRNLLPGDFIYEDVNGDNFIDASDLRPNFHDATPKINYGLSLSASYKGFDLNVLFQGAALFSKRIGVVYGTMFWGNANTPAYFMDRWHKADPYDPNSEWIPGKWPAMRTTDQAEPLYYDSDAWRKNCTYLRIKNIAIGYTIPQRYIQKIGLTNLRIFFDASNVYTWCDEYVKMFDPEKIAGDADASWNYPLMKAYNFGLSINF